MATRRTKLTITHPRKSLSPGRSRNPLPERRLLRVEKRARRAASVRASENRRALSTDEAACLLVDGKSSKCSALDQRLRRL